MQVWYGVNCQMDPHSMFSTLSRRDDVDAPALAILGHCAGHEQLLGHVPLSATRTARSPQYLT